MDTAAGQQLPLWNDGAIEGAWRVRRSVRARRLGLRVFRDGSVEVVAPPGTGARQVAGFVERHRAWIERHRRRRPPLAEPFPPERIELWALGETWHCRAAGEPDGEPAGESPGEGLRELRLAADARAAHGTLLAWLHERAAATLGPWLRGLAAELGAEFRHLRIRRQRTRWGSCSARGTISLNCCLLFQRPAVVRYLLVHELAHLRHMNHSRRFWELVARHEPAWRELDRELLRGWQHVPDWVYAPGYGR